jgi:hypothetical protein
MATKKSVKVLEKELKTQAINPLDPINFNKPLWVVYGSKYQPSVLCCLINNTSGYTVIWGYSVWANSAGFRTLGQCLSTWMEKSDEVLFFDVQVTALEYLNLILTPKKGMV